MEDQFQPTSLGVTKLLRLPLVGATSGQCCGVERNHREGGGGKLHRQLPQAPFITTPHKGQRQCVQAGVMANHHDGFGVVLGVIADDIENRVRTGKVEGVIKYNFRR